MTKINIAKRLEFLKGKIYLSSGKISGKAITKIHDKISKLERQNRRNR